MAAVRAAVGPGKDAPRGFDLAGVCAATAHSIVVVGGRIGRRFYIGLRGWNTMRFVVRGLAFIIGSGAVTLALADPAAPAAASPSVSTPPATAVAPATAAPASSAPAAAASATQAKPATDADEKRLIAEGYKPEMRNGEKVYCRREETLGTRLGSDKHCATAAQLKSTEQASKAWTDGVQRSQVNPVGR
jgi:hypothetical protein